jgi:hypothetical protein
MGMALWEREWRGDRGLEGPGEGGTMHEAS